MFHGARLKYLNGQNHATAANKKYARFSAVIAWRPSPFPISTCRLFYFFSWAQPFFFFFEIFERNGFTATRRVYCL